MAPTVAVQFELIEAPYVETQGEVRTLHLPVPTTEEEKDWCIQHFRKVALEFDRELCGSGGFTEHAGGAAAVIDGVMTTVGEGVPVKEAIERALDGNYAVSEMKAMGPGVTEIILTSQKETSQAQSSTQNFVPGVEPTQQAESSSLHSLD